MHRNIFLQRHIQFLAVLVLVLVEATAVAMYLILTPPDVLYFDSQISYVTHVECDYGIVALPVQYLYNWVILAFSFVFAFKARHLPENFGESRLIASSMGLSLLLWVMSFICFLISHGSLKAIFQNAVLIVVPWIFMGFLYFPKCYIILLQPHRNTAQELRRMTLAHVQRRTEHALESSASHKFSMAEAEKQSDRRKNFRRATSLALVDRGCSPLNAKLAHLGPRRHSEIPTISGRSKESLASLANKPCRGNMERDIEQAGSAISLFMPSITSAESFAYENDIQYRSSHTLCNGNMNNSNSSTHSEDVIIDYAAGQVKDSHNAVKRSPESTGHIE